MTSTVDPRATTGSPPPSPDGGGEPVVVPPASVLAEAPTIEERPLPTQVSAAWELELLISGAVTFALLQLPSVIEELRALLLPVFGGTRAGQIVVMMAAVYAKSALYTLIVAFVVNLAARAYWVGLVGLHSVYPNGPRWERLRMGPVFTDLYRQRSASLPAVIARVDNFASVIFSFAFLVVVWVVGSVLSVGLFGGIAWLVSRALFGGRYVLALASAFALLLLGPGMIAGYVDKRRGDRPDSAARERLHRWARYTARVTGVELYGPIFFTLTSNVGRNRMVGLAYATMIGALAFSMGERILRDGVVGPGGPTFVPDDPDVRAVHAEHYESLVTPRPGDRVITIQSDVIDGPYVRLFIPFRDARHAAAMRSCPGASAAAPSPGADSGRAARVLGCLTALHAVRLDGVPIAEPGFRFYRHPVSGVHGMLAYLPVGALAAGPHAVLVQPVPQLPEERERGRPNPPVEIPFWR
jgi:hypothetical protein